jgi:hypothetical protein
MGGGSSQTVGYRYYMGLHMAICHGPVDSLNQIHVAERSLAITPQTTNATIFVNKPSLFGGDEKEGGILGDIDIEFGALTQGQNAYLVSQFGATTTPAFRGVSCVVFRKTSQPLGIPIFGRSIANYVSSSGGGYIAAMSPYPKPWSFDVTDIPGGDFNPTKQIVNGTANGGHIIYDCITNTDWGIGLSTIEIDVASFTLVTDALFTEGFGLSMIYGQQSTMADFMEEVLTHINAVMYTSRVTGKFVLKLIRDDYDPNTLPIFDESNIASFVSFERPAFAELVNEVVLTYRVKGAFVDTTITVQDLASVQAQGGVISQTVSFAGIDDDDIAARVAQRELKQTSTPLARVRIIVNRSGWNINPGDVIKLSWAAYGISGVVLRVGSVDYGSLESGLIGIDAVEDIFGLPLNSYINPQATGWSDEVSDPVVAPSTRAFETPYFVVETTFEQSILDTVVSTDSFAQVVAEFPDAPTVAARLYTDFGAAEYYETIVGEFAPTALLNGALSETTKTSIPIVSFKGGESSIVIGGYAYLNNEILRIDSVDLVGGLIDVGRGYLDSIPQSHTTSSIIYFADSNDMQDPTFYENSDSVNLKVITQTSQGELPIATAAIDVVVMDGRRAKPYNASQIKIAGGYFPATLTDFVSVAVTWEHQDRTQQLTVGGQDWYETALGTQEAGTTYTVRFYNHDTSTLLSTQSNIAGKMASFTPGTAIGVPFNMRVEVESVRDGITSDQTFIHIFSYTKPLGVRTTEAADTRTTTAGDRRVLEG